MDDPKVRVLIRGEALLVQIGVDHYAHWSLVLATELVRHLAIVAAMPDGEDSAGRQKLRLLTPEEVALRAFEIAEKLFVIGRDTGSLYRIVKEEDEPPPF